MALLELIKLFQKLFAAYGSFAKYDLLFLATPSGHLNYKGTETFLNELPESYAQKIEFALCLDSIGHNEEVYLHISRLPRDKEATSLNLFEVSYHLIYIARL
jgi:hypothetical protein